MGFGRVVVAKDSRTGKHKHNRGSIPSDSTRKPAVNRVVICQLRYYIELHIFRARDLDSRSMTGPDLLAKNFLIADAQDYALFSGFIVVYTSLEGHLSMPRSTNVLCGRARSSKFQKYSKVPHMSLPVRSC